MGIVGLLEDIGIVVLGAAGALVLLLAWVIRKHFRNDP